MKHLYQRLAKYYDLIYHYKNYEKESRFVDSVVKKFKIKGKKLLDVACGTASHAIFLKRMGYSITGIDINKQMLEVARSKLKGIKFVKADMRNFNLHKKFDIITCLFSSMHYTLTYKQLERTLRNFNRHLKDRGIVIFDMGFNKENWDEGNTSVISTKSKNVFLVRSGLSTSKKDMATIQLAYTIMTKDRTKFVLEKQKLKMFETKKIKKLMEKIGFKVMLYQGFTSKSWNKKAKASVLFVGIKQNTF